MYMNYTVSYRNIQKQYLKKAMFSNLLHEKHRKCFSMVASGGLPIGSHTSPSSMAGSVSINAVPG